MDHGRKGVVADIQVLFGDAVEREKCVRSQADAKEANKAESQSEFLSDGDIANCGHSCVPFFSDAERGRSGGRRISIHQGLEIPGPGIPPTHSSSAVSKET
jgi:hypothetical protein